MSLLRSNGRESLAVNPFRCQSRPIHVSKRGLNVPAYHENNVELLSNTGQHRVLTDSLVKPLSGIKGTLVIWDII